MKEEHFNELMLGLQQGAAILRGEMQPSRTIVVEVPEVVAIRRKSKASQAQFAAMLGISVNTLQNWEQGRCKPEGPARVLLHVMDRHPEAVMETAKALAPQRAKEPIKTNRGRKQTLTAKKSVPVATTT